MTNEFISASKDSLTFPKCLSAELAGSKQGRQSRREGCRIWHEQSERCAGV